MVHYDYFSGRFDEPGELERFQRDCERFQPLRAAWIPDEALEEPMDEVFAEEPALKYMIAPIGLGIISDCQVCYFALRLAKRRVWTLLN